MPRRLVTRRLLARRLVLNAATTPLNVGVPAAVVIAALVLGALWLIAVAAVVYFGMVVDTVFRDTRAAERVGAETYAAARLSAAAGALPATLAPEIAQPLAAARVEAERIREAVDTLEQPLPEVNDEVLELLGETDRIARRAQLVHDYLAEQDRDGIRSKLESYGAELAAAPAAAGAMRDAMSALREHLEVIDQLDQQLARLRAELEHLVASLAVIRGQLLRAAAAEESLLDQELARELRELRTTVGDRATALHDVFSTAAS